MFSNFKIGTRLIAGFLVVASISAVVGLVGISNSAKMNDLAESMYSRELLGLSHIKEANINLIYTAAHAPISCWPPARKSASATWPPSARAARR